MKHLTPLLVPLICLSCSEYELTAKYPDVDPGSVTNCEFAEVDDVRVEDTIMREYTCNPVFSGTGENWAPGIGSVGFYATEVHGHPFYQLWYTSAQEQQEVGECRDDQGFGNYAMGYAVSANGTDWDVHPSNPLILPDVNAWDADSIASQTIVWDPVESEYVMAYQGFTLGDGLFDPGIWGLGIAKSKDGVSWSKSMSNPVINFSELGGDLFNPGISPCWPLTITMGQRGEFRGYMAATSPEDSFLGETNCNIYSMTSFDADGPWVIDESKPVLAGGDLYDTRGVTSASVVEYGGILYMFYIGFTDWIQCTGYQTANNTTLNLATSTDGGDTWIKDPNNPLPITKNFPQTGTVSDVAAQVIGDRIHLWVTDTYVYEDCQEIDGNNASGTDNDGDGYVDADDGGTDCNDNNPFQFPGAEAREEQAIGYFLFEPPIAESTEDTAE